MQMKPQADGKQGFEFVAKGLESYSSHALKDGFTVYENIVFNDGTMLRNVNVDNAIDAKFKGSLDDPDVVFVVKKFLNAWVLYAIETNGSLRVGVLKGYRRGVVATVFLFALLACIAFLGGYAGGGVGTFLLVGAGLLAIFFADYCRRMVSVVTTASRLRGKATLGLA